MAVRSRFFYYYVLLIILYVSLTFLATPARATLTKYHISVGMLRALNFTVIIPLIVIWYAALYGYQRIRRYSRLVRKSEDGKQVSKLADGLMVITIGLPLTATVNRGLTLLAQSHPHLATAASIVNSYDNLLYVLIAFILIGKGARGLSEIVQHRPSFRATQILALVIIAVGVFYSYLISNPHADTYETYHLPLWVVHATIVIPYIFVWFNGLLAAYEIWLYAVHVAGVFYRRIWNYVAAGIATIIGSSIVLQCITTVSKGLRNLSLKWLLLIIYCLLGLIALGYVMVALGAKRLTKIEEV